jgi:hypothetical protein
MKDETRVGVWGVGRWLAASEWGEGDPQRRPLVIDAYAGQGYWGRHSWASDFWLRW